MNPCLRIVPAVWTRLRAPRVGEAHNRLAKRRRVERVSHDDPQAIIIVFRSDPGPSDRHQEGGQS